MTLRRHDPSHEGEVTHVMNEAGRVFPVTDQLLKRNDMTPCPAPGAPVVKAPDGFVLGKATKQQIQDKGIEDFNVEISMKLTLAQMRADYDGLGSGDPSDADSSADSDSDDSSDISDASDEASDETGSDADEPSGDANGETEGDNDKG